MAARASDWDFPNNTLQQGHDNNPTDKKMKKKKTVVSTETAGKTTARDDLFQGVRSKSEREKSSEENESPSCRCLTD